MKKQNNGMTHGLLMDMKAEIFAARSIALDCAVSIDLAKATGSKEAAARARAYQETGVDAIFPVGVKTKADLELIASDLTLPLIVGGIGPELMDKTYLASQGVRVCLQGHHTLPAAAQAVYDTMKHLRDGGAPAELTGQPSAELKSTMTSAADYERWAKEFL